MDERLRAVVEMNEATWTRFERTLADVGPDEIDWRPLPQANTINLILRHLRIDAAWHVHQVEREDHILSPAVQPHPESLALDFDQNLKELGQLVGRFIDVLRRMSLPELERRTAGAYKDFPQGSIPGHFLGYHFALHLAGHDAQIRGLRNLYRKVRGQPARFYPNNPTFPEEESPPSRPLEQG